MKKQFYMTLVVLAFYCGAHAQKAAIFATGGKAIRGYDPVSFFVSSKAVKGQDSLVYRWKDADWQFSSRTNLDLFRADPAKYAPQYGGYCAFGTAEGHKAPTETDTWTIVNDKLYFNYNKKVKEEWVKDEAGYIKKADKNWVNLQNQ